MTFLPNTCEYAFNRNFMMHGLAGGKLKAGQPKAESLRKLGGCHLRGEMKRNLECCVTVW